MSLAPDPRLGNMLATLYTISNTLEMIQVPKSSVSIDVSEWRQVYMRCISLHFLTLQQYYYYEYS